FPSDFVDSVITDLPGSTDFTVPSMRRSAARPADVKWTIESRNATNGAKRYISDSLCEHAHDARRYSINSESGPPGGAPVRSTSDRANMRRYSSNDRPKRMICSSLSAIGPHCQRQRSHRVVIITLGNGSVNPSHIPIVFAI